MVPHVRKSGSGAGPDDATTTKRRQAAVGDLHDIDAGTFAIPDLMPVGYLVAEAPA